MADEIRESAAALDKREETLIPMEEIKAQWDKELKEAEQEEKQVQVEKVREQVLSGYFNDFIESTSLETTKKLEILKKTC